MKKYIKYKTRVNNKLEPVNSSDHNITIQKHCINQKLRGFQPTNHKNQMVSGIWKCWTPKVCKDRFWTKSTMPHLALLKLSHRGNWTLPDSFFFVETSLTVSSFSERLTTWSLFSARPLFSPRSQFVTNPLSYSTTITSAPLLSTFEPNVPEKDTCNISGDDLWKVACKPD